MTLHTEREVGHYPTEISSMKTGGGTRKTRRSKAKPVAPLARREPIVPAPAEGSKRARGREIEQAIRAREVYANTPTQPITRQQRRAAERASRT